MFCQIVKAIFLIIWSFFVDIQSAVRYDCRRRGKTGRSRRPYPVEDTRMSCLSITLFGEVKPVQVRTGEGDCGFPSPLSHSSCIPYFHHTRLRLFLTPTSGKGRAETTPWTIRRGKLVSGSMAQVR